MDLRNQAEKQTITCLINGDEEVVISRDKDGKVWIIAKAFKLNNKSIVEETMIMVLGEPGHVHFSI